ATLGLPLTSASNSLPDGFSFLVRNTAAQDDRFRGAFDILLQAIDSRAFPACSLAVTYRGELVAHKALGRFTYEESSPAVSADILFDLASVTKVVATTAMAMILYERGMLDLEAPVAAIVPEFASGNARRGEVTLRMLLAHSSGLPAYEKLFLRAHDREELLRAAFATQLTSDPGAHAEYSDIGFIILGVALERLADEALDVFCQREVFGPLAMSRTTFNPAKALRANIPPTTDDLAFRHRIIQGEVQDENASILGGVAGHAGLFSNAEDIARFAHSMLNGGYPILRPETVRLFSRRESAPEGTSRALGWDTPSSPSQSGRYFSARAFGHLGYTGTSLWIDPERQLSITLLTNRTWPDCQNQAIKQVRPAFHDAVGEALPEEKHA
ncbi:MAG: serine hydrolase domain-containing protein, partial [Terriglobales bacterium]